MSKTQVVKNGQNFFTVKGQETRLFNLKWTGCAEARQLQLVKKG